MKFGKHTVHHIRVIPNGQRDSLERDIGPAVRSARRSPPNVVFLHHSVSFAQRDASQRSGECSERLPVLAVDDDHPIVSGSLGLAVEFELVHSCQVRGELDRSDLLWDTVDPDGPL